VVGRARKRKKVGQASGSVQRFCRGRWCGAVVTQVEEGSVTQVEEGSVS